MTGPSIFLATPCYGGQLFSNYVASILALQRECDRRGIMLHVEMIGGDALISRARGRLAADFLARPEFTHLLFVDADIGFSPEQVFRLLEADYDLSGGAIPAKRFDVDRIKRAIEAGAPDPLAASLNYVVRFLPGETKSIQVDDNGFGRVSYVGTGFMMVKRAAMERIVAAHPELRAKHRDIQGTGPQEATMVFDTMIETETGQYLSEDYAFCRRWLDLGGEIYADVHGRFTHVGHSVYRGGLLDARIG